jgi:hypothetical protein
MKRILVTLLVLLSIITLIQFSPNAIIPVSALGPSITSVTLTAPANNAALTSTYIALSGKVVTSPASVVKDAQVKLNFVGNTTYICPIQNATATGTFSCNYQVEKAGNYTWRATAEGNPGGTNMTASTSAALSFNANPIVYQMPLVAGWNLISLPIIPASSLIGKVLAAEVAANDFTIVWSYQNGKWSSATLSNGKMSGALTTMQDGLGYWIYMTKADTVYVTGSVIPPASPPPSYSLVQGWNLVGFKPEPTVTSETVGSYLSSISGSYDQNNVWIYDNTNQSWIRADSSYMLQPGQALWILVTSPSSVTLRP